jgi:hypothetical protein
VFGLLMRHAWPLAIMPSADQVPVKSPHCDRICITCCSPFPTSTSRRLPDAIPLSR